jgi:hypothetical protein
VTIEAFTVSCGPAVVIPNTPGEVFSLLFTGELLQRIADESNKYAKECTGADKYSRWSEVSAEELKAYLGFCIMMGVVNLPSFDDYWRKDQMLHYTPVAERMARNRFKDITRYFHFVDYSALAPRSDPSYDRLGIILPLLHYLGQQFRVLFHPSANIAIDEAMIKLQGCSTMKQYMPLKPIRSIKHGYWQTLKTDILESTNICWVTRESGCRSWGPCSTILAGRLGRQTPQSLF